MARAQPRMHQHPLGNTIVRAVSVLMRNRKHDYYSRQTGTILVASLALDHSYNLLPMSSGVSWTHPGSGNEDPPWVQAVSHGTGSTKLWYATHGIVQE